MAVLKVNGCARAALLALAMLAASAQVATAETIVLTCQGHQAPFMIKINTDNNTVFNSVDPPDSGTHPARITDAEISWDNSQGPRDVGHWQFTLNRITGNLHAVGTGTATGANFDYQCHKSEKQF
jgi:hypothetical protein